MELEKKTQPISKQSTHRKQLELKKMSITSSIPSIKPLTSSASTCSSSSVSSSSSSFRCVSMAKPSVLTIRGSQTEGPIRRPVAPSLNKPTPPSPPPPTSPSLVPSPQPPTVAEVSRKVDKNVITLELQRKMAKELQEYFKQKKLDEADSGPLFGFLAKNEISNGRWAMFGFAVGMLTEYATGSDFVDQVKILLSNCGIVDLD